MAGFARVRIKGILLHLQGQCAGGVRVGGARAGGARPASLHKKIQQKVEQNIWGQHENRRDPRKNRTH